MTPMMPKDTPQKTVVPQPRVPMMDDLRKGGSSMKVFGDGNVPMMGNLNAGSMEISQGNQGSAVTPRATMHESGETKGMKMRENHNKSS